MAPIPPVFKPGIALPNPFVVLGLRKHHIAFPIGQHEHRKLDAGQVLLHHHLFGGLSELPLEHILQLLLRLLQVIDDQHSFPRSQSVRLQHIGRLQPRQVGLSLGHRIIDKGAEFARWGSCCLP